MGRIVSNVTRGVGRLASSVLGLEAPSPSPAVQTAPAVEAPKPMPIPNDQAAMDARRKSMAEQRRRHGRASTVYTAADNGDRLGG